MDINALITHIDWLKRNVRPQCYQGHKIDNGVCDTCTANKAIYFNQLKNRNWNKAVEYIGLTTSMYQLVETPKVNMFISGKEHIEKSSDILLSYLMNVPAEYFLTPFDCKRFPKIVSCDILTRGIANNQPVSNDEFYRLTNVPLLVLSGLRTMNSQMHWTYSDIMAIINNRRLPTIITSQYSNNELSGRIPDTISDFISKAEIKQ